MQYRKCFSCGEDKPQNDVLAINRELLCSNCIDEKVQTGVSVDLENAVFEFDSTVCSFCGHDADSINLPLKSERPICENCINSIESKISPTWLKPFLFLIGFSIIGGVVHNWKYFEGYFVMNEAMNDFLSGNMASAYHKSEKLVAEIPNSKDLKYMKNYYGGMYYLSVDSSKKALEMLENISESDEFMDYLKNEARLGAAFDEKDYYAMLYYAEEIYKTDTSNAFALLSVASANACLFVTTNNKDQKKISEDLLKDAITLSGSDENILHYANKIEHRIVSKRILTEEQFVKEFPNGWNK